MLNIQQIFTKAYDYLETAIAGGILELRKDKADIISSLDPKGVQQAVLSLQEAVKSGLIDVKRSIDDKEQVESVAISNPEAITKEISAGLSRVADVIQSELGKIDKEIVIKNDLSSLTALFKTGSDKKDLISALKKIEDKIEQPEITDYTLILSDLADCLDEISSKNINLDVIEANLSEISRKLDRKPENWLDKYDNGEGRLKVDTGEIAKGVKQGLYGYSHETQLKNKAGVLINPMSEEKGQDIVDAIGNIVVPAPEGGALETTQQSVLSAIQGLGGSTAPIDQHASSVTKDFGGTETGTVADTFTVNSQYYQVQEDGTNGIQLQFDFTLPNGFVGSEIHSVGRYQGSAAHYLEVFAYNWTTLGWDTISSAGNRLDHSTTDYERLFTITAQHTSMAGAVRVRIRHNTTTYNTGHNLYIDHIAVHFSGAGITKISNADSQVINPSTEEKQDTGNATLTAIEANQLPDNHQVTVSNFPATQPVSIATMPSTPVTGTFFQATQPVSATSLPLPAGAATETTLSSGAVRLKKTVALTGSGTVHTPASGKKIRIYNLKFSLSADMTDVAFKFASGSAFEKFLAPKTGGLYGTNLHPNFNEGGVDQALNCDITGTGTVQVNIDYQEI